MKIEVFNSTKEKYLPQKKLARIVKYILVSEKKTFDVNLVLTSQNKIHNLNKTFRNQDKATDVLSFISDDREDPFPFTSIGEIYICVPIARQQAKQAGHSVLHELLFLASHGALHLCGYTHETDSKYKLIMSKSENALERIKQQC